MTISSQLSHESQCIVFASVSLNSVLLSNTRPASRVQVDSNWIYLTSVVKEREGRVSKLLVTFL